VGRPGGGILGVMRALERLEAILQDLVERPQWLLTPRRFHPLALASAVTRAFEEQVLPLGDRVVAPNEFTVRLHPDDFGQLAPLQRTLERELALYVGRAADERRLTLPAPPTVTLTPDEAVRPGDVAVQAVFGEAPAVAPAATVARRLPASGFTERIPRPTGGQPFAPPPNGRARLELLSESGGVVRAFPLDAPMVTIGRRSGNDIALLDLEVSRQHARIDFVPPRYYVSDLGSTNGTRLNGRPVVGRQALSNGDVIELGRQRLRFRQGER
jgi:hypothetical protein